MKKRILLIIVFISIAITSFCDQFSSTRENRRFLSQFDKAFTEDVETDEWVILVKEIGKNKIEIAFPEDPELKFGEEKSVFSAEEKGKEYSLTLLDPSFDLAAYLENKNFIKSGNILDLPNHERIHILDEKIILLKSLNTSDEDHQKFTSSFHVITPLPK